MIVIFFLPKYVRKHSCDKNLCWRQLMLKRSFHFLSSETHPWKILIWSCSPYVKEDQMVSSSYFSKSLRMTCLPIFMPRTELCSRHITFHHIFHNLKYNSFGNLKILSSHQSLQLILILNQSKLKVIFCFFFGSHYLFPYPISITIFSTLNPMYLHML